jgi:hypothetical protein
MIMAANMGFTRGAPVVDGLVLRSTHRGIGFLVRGHVMRIGRGHCPARRKPMFGVPQLARATVSAHFFSASR